MQTYIGIKKASAKPMSKVDAERLLSRVIPGTPLTEGYLVQYEDGYQSWSPKDVFEKAYRVSDGLTFSDVLIMFKVNGSGPLKARRKGFLPAPLGVFLEKDGVLRNGAYFGESVPYIPTNEDMLATDWEFI